MSKVQKTIDRILRGASDANIAFHDLRAVLRHLGFDERVRGSHHIFTRADVPQILNLQARGGQAKPYQVKQVRGILLELRVANEPETGADDDPQQDPSPTSQEAPDSGMSRNTNTDTDIGTDESKGPAHG